MRYASSGGDGRVGGNSHSGRMSRDSYLVLAEHAARHHGVFTRSAAIDAGVAASSVADGVAAGRFLRLWPGVYAVAGSPDTQSQRLAGAVASLPGMAALSHRTAAELWGITDRGIRIIELVTSRWDRVRRSGLRVHESQDLIAEDIVFHEGLSVTTPARTIVDLGAVNPWLVEPALETGVRKDLVTVAEVEAFVERVARRGRRGVGVIRPLLEARRRWDGATESALEDLFLKTVAELSLPTPVGQFVVRDDADEFVCRADFAYPDERILVELDSEKHHMDRMTFRSDRAKQNRAVVLGWTVLRFTWWDLRHDPYGVGAQVRDSLANSHLPNRRLATTPRRLLPYNDI